MDGHTGETTRDERKISTRSAQFRRSGGGGDAAQPPTETGDSRRAQYEPPEEEAKRHGVLRSFRDDMIAQSTRGADATGESARGLRAAVLAEESLGEYARAQRRIHGLAMLREPTVRDRRLYRRLLRATGRDAPLIESFERSVRQADEPPASLLAIEGAYEAWRRGRGLDEVRTWIERADVESNDGVGSFSRLRHLELRYRAALESGNLQDARQLLEGGLASFSDADLQATIDRRLAFVEHAVGASSEARQRLARLREEGEGLEGLERFLCWADGAEDQIREIWTDIDPGDGLATWTIPASADRWVRGDAVDAAGLLELAVDRQPGDRVVAEFRTSALETLETRDGDVDRTADLVELLNRRLEAATDDDVRVRTLTRLGRLYERRVGRAEAAADVYREALEIRPDHGPAARALGRLYARADNWEALAELYEHELEHLGFEGRRWRHRYRLAELYEQRLDAPEKAVEHYRAVLRQKPGYAPAIKGAARTLRELEQYVDLVELYLDCVTDAPSDRRRVDLLDRAATLAEDELGRLGVAIGAWEEAIELDPSYSRAYASLGRLYSRTERWSDLVELNQMELERVEDDHEAAELHVRTAEICEEKLDASRRAAGHFQRALTLVPDYLPALEGLGRLYKDAGRWEELVHMTEQELREAPDGPGVARQLTRMAELVEQRLERPDEAIELYAEVLERRPEAEHAKAQLLRLHRAAENWEAVVVLLRDRAQRLEGRERAMALGELAVVEGWHRDRRGDAFSAFAAAIDADPANPHWVRGVERTWPASELDAVAVADRLETYLEQPLPEDVRGVYCEVVGRLREHAAEGASAGRNTRELAGIDSLERRLAVETGRAEAGDRGALDTMRAASPEHPLEAIARQVEGGLEEDDIDDYREHAGWLTDAEQRIALGEAEPGAIGRADEVADDGLELIGQMQSVLRDGLDDPSERPDEEGDRPFPLARLRAVEADRQEHYRSFKRWTLDELGQRRQRDAIVARLLEIGEFARRVDKSEQARDFNRQAARVTFANFDDAELNPAIDEEELVGDIRDETIDELYGSLRASEQWELLRRSLRAHVGRDGLDDADRVELFEALAEVCRERLGDVEGAIAALTHCWQISERETFLETLVELDLEADALADAIRHQRRHFEATMRRGADESDVADSGIRLAELLRRTDDRVEEGVGILETLVATVEQEEPLRRVRRELAYAQLSLDRSRDAAESFLAYLGDEPEERDLGEWRELVRIFDRELGETTTAREFQWKIVEAEPSSRRALDRLVDLAHRSGRLEHCIDRLEGEAETRDGEARRAMLERAATSAEEDLRDPLRADGLYEQLLQEVDDEKSRADLLRRRTLCLVQVMGREPEALEVFGRLLDYDAFDATVYRAMVPFFERQQSYDRARLTRQILDALDCDIEREAGRRKTTPSREFPDDVIDEFLVPERMPGSVFRALRQLDPLAQKVFSVDATPTEGLEGTVPDERLELVDSAFDDAARAFGLGRVHLEVGEDGPAVPRVDPGRRPTVRMRRSLFESLGEREFKFAAGWACAIGWAQLRSLFDIEPVHLWHLAEGLSLHHRSEPLGEEPRSASREAADAIGSPFLTVARRRAVGPVERASEALVEADPGEWPRAVREFAARAGLVLCGDVGAAARCLARFHDPRGQLECADVRDQIAERDLAHRLVRFAYTDDYLRARYEIGLCGQPSGVSIS